jgi:hypothetical protein
MENLFLCKTNEKNQNQNKNGIQHCIKAIAVWL